MIEDMAKRCVGGNDPHVDDLFFRRCSSSGCTQRPDVSGMGCFSALEMACWDIIGKARNRPVWALLGGKMNARIRSYTYLYPEPDQDAAEFWINPDMTAQAAAKCVAQGFTAVKFDPAGPMT